MPHGKIQITFHDKNRVDTQTIELIHAQQMIEAHKRGKHPWGSMRRDCPLCQLGKPS